MPVVSIGEARGSGGGVLLGRRRAAVSAGRFTDILGADQSLQGSPSPRAAAFDRLVAGNPVLGPDPATRIDPAVQWHRRHRCRQYRFFFAALNRLSERRARLLIETLAPAFTVLVAWFWLAERLPAMTLLPFALF